MLHDLGVSVAALHINRLSVSVCPLTPEQKVSSLLYNQHLAQFLSQQLHSEINEQRKLKEQKNGILALKKPAVQ